MSETLPITSKQLQTLRPSQEPESLGKLREAALNQFEALAWPVKTDEEWRRTDPVPFHGADTPVELQAFELKLPKLPDALIQQGVLFGRISDLLKQAPEKLTPFLFTSGTPEELVKFVALHQTLARDGLFCYLPKGVVIEEPLEVTLLLKQPGMTFPHVVIALEEGAQLTLIDERQTSGLNGKASYVNEQIEIFLKRGAQLQYIHHQQWGPQVRELLSQRVLIGQDAKFLNVTVGMGSNTSKANVETVLNASGAEANLLGLFFGHDQQHFDCHTLQDHRAPDTTTDLFYESALKDKAKAVYTGLIRVEKKAQKTNAFQTNRNLILSRGAKADSIPKLEIEADDVRCSHAATAGPVDENQLFYLMSRGIPQNQAEQLIVTGFFDQVLRRIPVEKVRDTLSEEVALRLAEDNQNNKERNE